MVHTGVALHLVRVEHIVVDFLPLNNVGIHLLKAGGEGVDGAVIL